MKKLTLVAILLSSLTATSQGQETVSVLTTEAPVEAAVDFINHLHQNEWVRLDANDTVQGRVAVLTPDGAVEGRVGVNVLVSYEGKVLFETLTGSDGKFEIEGLRPGTYAFQSRGDYTFAAFALHVLPSSAARLSSELQVYASVVPSDRVRSLIEDNSVPGDLSSSDDVYYRMFKEDPLAERRAFNGSHKVVLKDGALIGRVSRPGWTFAEQDLRGTIAQIIKEGEVVARAAVGRDGFFKVEKFSPGVYDLIVTGDDGVAALAFQAIEPEGLAKHSDGKSVRLVSTQSGMVADSLCCEMIQPPEVMSCCDPVGTPIADAGIPADPGLPMAGGGFVGPGGFSGGGFGGAGGGFGGAGGGGFGGAGGGIGGLGGLLGVAGLAVGVAALSDNDNTSLGTPIAP